MYTSSLLWKERTNLILDKFSFITGRRWRDTTHYCSKSATKKKSSSKSSNSCTIRSSMLRYREMTSGRNDNNKKPTQWRAMQPASTRPQQWMQFADQPSIGRLNKLQPAINHRQYMVNRCSLDSPACSQQPAECDTARSRARQASTQTYPTCTIHTHTHHINHMLWDVAMQ